MDNSATPRHPATPANISRKQRTISSDDFVIVTVALDIAIIEARLRKEQSVKPEHVAYWDNAIRRYQDVQRRLENA